MIHSLLDPNEFLGATARVLTALPWGIPAAACAALVAWGLWPERKPRPPPQPALEGGYTLKPDTPLADAIYFAATGSWEGRSDGTDAHLVRMQRAIDDFTTLAANDRIRVFYRPFRDAPHDKLPGSSWYSHRINLMDVLEGEAVLRRRKDDSRVETCHDLRVSRAQWDAKWDYLRSTLS